MPIQRHPYWKNRCSIRICPAFHLGGTQFARRIDSTSYTPITRCRVHCLREGDCTSVSQERNSSHTRYGWPFRIIRLIQYKPIWTWCFFGDHKVGGNHNQSGSIPQILIKRKEIYVWKLGARHRRHNIVLLCLVVPKRTEVFIRNQWTECFPLLVARMVPK